MKTFLPKKYLLGFDIGTEGSKGIIVDFQGEVVAYEYCRHEVYRPKIGWAEHNAEQVWWNDFKYISKKLIEQSGINSAEIQAIGCSAITPCMLPVDEKGTPLRNAILYGIDTRADEEIRYLNNRIGKQKIEKLAKASLSPQSVGPKILWFKRHEPDKFQKTYKFLTATSYIVSKLTGKYVIDYGNAIGNTPLFDFLHRKWDNDMCKEIGITPDYLPDIFPAYEVVGEIRPEAAMQTGLYAGTKVITGTGDYSSELFSMGGESDNTLIVYGSTMLVFNITDEPVYEKSLMTGFYPYENLYIIGGGTATSGSITKWFRDEFGQEELQLEKEKNINAYQILSGMASEIPAGSEGLVLLPYFTGERTPIWDGKARGILAGLTLSHTKAHVYRAILEGISYSIKHNLETMEKTGLKINKIISTGGGIQSNLWTQIISDVTGREQLCLPGMMGSPAGSAYLAGYGEGVFNDLSVLKEKWIKDTWRVRPRDENIKKYESYYKVYKELYPSTKKQMNALADLGNSDSE